MYALLVLENLIIAVCYLAIALLVGIGLWRARHNGISLLGLATLGIFFTCSLGHFMHVIVHATPASPGPLSLFGICQILLGSTTNATLTLQMIVDGLTIIPATMFLALRRRYGLLASGEGVILAYERTVASQRERERELHAYSTDLEEQITQRRVAEETLERANSQLTAELRTLEQRTREIIALNQLAVQLQTCQTIDEACTTTRDAISRTMGSDRGGIHISVADGNTLKTICTWEDDPVRTHLLPDNDGLTMCVPLLAQGERWGVLVAHWLPTTSTAIGEADQTHTWLAQTVADYLAITIAGISLRVSLRDQAMRDSLTGLFNRRAMEQRFVHEIMQAKQNRTSIGVLMIDIDFFKSINDTLGHQAGDEVLQQVSRVIEQQSRRSDMVCRYGGEEFVVIMPDVSASVATARAEQIRLAIRKIVHGNTTTPVSMLTVSLGIAFYPAQGMQATEVLAQADLALYAAKQAGRDCWVIAGQHTASLGNS